MAKEKSELTTALDEHLAKTLEVVSALMTWQDINLHDPKEVHRRCMEYFNLMAQLGKRPLVVGLAMALGIDRRRLYEITRGQVTPNKETRIPQECKDIIIKAYRVLELNWEDLITNGKIPPISGIFLGKNNFGYLSDTEVIVTPKNPLGEVEDPEVVRKRIEEHILASVPGLKD